MNEILMRIVAPHYVAGIDWHLNDQGVWYIGMCAPIVFWMKKQNKSLEWVQNYCARKGFTVELYDVSKPQDHDRGRKLWM